jgi:RHS repeat-associated protein
VGEVGAATWIAAPRALRHVPPPLALLLVFGAAGVGAALLTRRAPVGIATTTSGVALLLLCAQTSSPPDFAWVHVDPLGTPLAVTSSPAIYAPAVAIWRAKYEPFGKATVNADPDGDSVTFALNVRFSGQYEDAEAGWHYNSWRTFDAGAGRYLEADPFGLPGGIFNAERSNWTWSGAAFLDGGSPYQYALSDPTNLRDATGLSTLHTRLMAAIATGNAAALRTLIGTGALSEEQEALAQSTLDRLALTAEEIIARECRGSINREFPSEFLDETLEQIMQLARQGIGAAQKALKLLNDSRFKK